MEIFDQTGRLLEYATVERQERRIAFYNAASQLTGTGILDISPGRVERFSVEGHRQGSLLLLLAPGVDDGG